jgi:hypothetical protein
VRYGVDVVVFGLEVLLQSQTMHTVCPRTPNVEKELDVYTDGANHVDGAKSEHVRTGCNCLF